MKINEGMRDACESISEAIEMMNGMFDSHDDNVKIPLIAHGCYEAALKRIHTSLYHLQRCERLNDESTD